MRMIKLIAAGLVVTSLIGCGGGSDSPPTETVIPPANDSGGNSDNGPDDNGDDNGTDPDDDNGPGDDTDTPVEPPPIDHGGSADWSETHYYIGGDQRLMAIDLPSREERIIASDLENTGVLYTHVESLTWPSGMLFGNTLDKLKLVVIDDLKNERKEFEHNGETVCASSGIDGDALLSPAVYVQWSGLDVTCDTEDDIVQRIAIANMAASDTDLKVARVESAWAENSLTYLMGVDKVSGKVVIMDKNGANPTAIGDESASEWHMSSIDGNKVVVSINGRLYGATFDMLKAGGISKSYDGTSITQAAMHKTRAVFVDGVKLVIWDFNFQRIKPVVNLGLTSINGHRIVNVMDVDTGGNYSYAKVNLADNAGQYWIAISIFNGQVYELGEASNWASGFLDSEDNAFFLSTVDHSGDTEGYTQGRLQAKLMYGSGATYATFHDSAWVPVLDRRTGLTDLVLMKGKSSNGIDGYMSYPTVIGVNERSGGEVETFGELPYNVEGAASDHRLEDGVLIGVERQGGLKELLELQPADGVITTSMRVVNQSSLNALEVIR
jgi:hypothetical protein